MYNNTHPVMVWLSLFVFQLSGEKGKAAHVKVFEKNQ